MATDPYRYFRVEASELLEGLSQGVIELERGSANSELLARLFRLAHTLKGAARVVRQIELADLAHEMEELLTRAREGGRGATPEEARELLSLLDGMAAHVGALDAAPAPEATPALRPAVEETFQTVRIDVEEMDAVLRAVTETGVHVSGLKGSVARLRQLTGLATALASRLGARSNATKSPDAKEQGLAEDLQVGLERVVQALAVGIERVDQELADVREGTDRLRLVPAQSLLPSLTRAARDAAQALGKYVDFELKGGALRLDAHVLGPLRDAVLHLVRNAVAHGIESPAERRAKGKAPTGKVELTVERRDRRVVFTCRDDGKGIDIQAVRTELVTRGLASALEVSALTDAAVLTRLLSARVSTSASVTQISGRGVGLDVVREVAARLKGDVSIESESGRGTHVELRVPVSLSALRAVVVEVGDTTVAIPLDAVDETLRLTSGSISRSSEGDSVAHGGKVIPFLPLSRALRRGSGAERTSWSAVVVSAGGRSAALGVDRLRGTLDVVVRPLPAAVRSDPVVAGASLDAEGNPQLVLDAAGVVAAAVADPGVAFEMAPELPPILVIDDSLTTRMLEQSILESAGYSVELAVSAEQGLEKAREKRYGLFIVDVEMPGMNGFDFVAQTRADAELSRVPAILVTSRGSAEDQLRGERAGASAYIVKGEFDQNLLLSNIRRLLG
jgi:two-component system, chemotaxis family, sensor kinase CheA